MDREDEGEREEPWKTYSEDLGVKGDIWGGENRQREGGAERWRKTEGGDKWKEDKGSKEYSRMLKIIISANVNLSEIENRSNDSDWHIITLFNSWPDASAPPQTRVQNIWLWCHNCGRTLTRHTENREQRESDGFHRARRQPDYRWSDEQMSNFPPEQTVHDPPTHTPHTHTHI